MAPSLALVRPFTHPFFLSLIRFSLRLGNNVRGFYHSVWLVTLLTSFPLFLVIPVLRACLCLRSAGIPAADDLRFLPLSVQRGGRVEIIANDQGHRITPSWVAFSDEERL